VVLAVVVTVPSVVVTMMVIITSDNTEILKNIHICT